MAEAQRASRVGAVALLAAGIWSVINGAIMAMHPEWMTALMANQYVSMGLDDQQIAFQEGFMSAVMPSLLAFGFVATSVVYAVLAWAQWTYMTRPIPMIMLGLMLYGALTGGVALATGLYAGLDLTFAVTMGLGWVVQGFCGVLYAASARGAFALYRLRRQP